jgi:hypothetical protein
VSELSELLAGIDKIRLRQSRAIAQVVDAQRARLDDGEPVTDGYDFAVAVLAAATDRSAGDIEEMGGSIIELGVAVARIMELAGFRQGEKEPVADPRTDLGASTAPLPPAAVIPRRKSAK